MYSIGKGSLSKFISGGCRRRLRLDLYAGVKSRAVANAVDKDARRPGAAYLKEQGRTHERACFQDLISVFRGKVIHGAPKPFEEGEEVSFENLALIDRIGDMRPGHFLIEAAFEVPTSFAALHGLDRLGDGNNRMGENRPDVIYAASPTDGLKAGCEVDHRRIITAAGEVETIYADDPRIGLLIVDVKMSADPNPAQFAELAYYGMTLACWIEEHGFADRYVVLADAMIWSGRHGGSSLKTYVASMANSHGVPTTKDYMRAWFQDLEEMPAEVMLGRLLRVLHVDVPEVVGVPNWQDLPIHVSSRCSGCDYLGYPWFEHEGETKDARYCWPTAQRTSDLSRIPGMTEGAAGKLGEHGIRHVEQFADLDPDDPVFEEHQGLRSNRHILLSRAAALKQGEHLGLPDGGGSSAVLPRFSDLRIAVSVDFDNASKQAFALGYEIVAAVPTGMSQVPEWKGSFERKATFARDVKLIMKPGIDAERRAFSQFLDKLHAEIQDLKKKVEDGYRLVGATDRRPTMQIYIWSGAAFEQFRTMMTRHLAQLPQVDARTGISPFAWLFPPETLLQDFETVGRKAPVTIVSQAVGLLALNIPHHYPQMAVANAYRHLRPGANREPYEYHLSYAFSDPLSDQIPSERGHELWSGVATKAEESFEAFCDRLKQAVSTRLKATLSIARKLAHDLNDRLVSQAPAIDTVFGPAKGLYRVANDLQVIYQHARLMNAAAEVDIDLTMAMSPEEREARYRSIRLVGMLVGEDRRRVLDAAGIFGRSTDRNLLAFRVSPHSRDANFKAGDFNLSVMPEDQLHRHATLMSRLREEFPDLDRLVPVDADKVAREFRTTVRQACGAVILAFDPRSLSVAVEVGPVPLALMEMGVFDFQFDDQRRGIIDPAHQDFFVGPRLKPVLEAIGTPPLSVEHRLVSASISKVSLRSERPGASTPVDPFIWDAKTLSRSPSGRKLELAMPGVVAGDRKPLPKQMEAIRKGIELRLSLLWGPPGTGKSATALGLLIGLLAEAEARGEPIRIAITGPTWVAIENVAAKLPKALKEVAFGPGVLLSRLKSPRVGEDTVDPALHAHIVATEAGATGLDTLIETLADRRRSAIVAGTSTQLAKLGKLVGMATADPEAIANGTALQPLFDYMLIDEASQMDMANAIVAFSTLAEGASVAVIGDDKQMPPVHPIDPPVGYEHVVGSVYDFYARYQVDDRKAPVEPTMLDTNFRSNAEIVGFFAKAGYRALSAANATQKMKLITPIGPKAPAGWPAGLMWSPNFTAIMEPDRPLVAVVHQDKYSSQRNVDEANAVASLVASLRGTLAPINGAVPFDDQKLFEEGIGVVTPHRAQRAAVIDAIANNLDLDGVSLQKMTASVDTVERFQGQQRVVMICSFGMADPDAIGGEEEFLFSLNRFNVITSRPMAKMVVLISRRMADHLPSDVEVLRGSHLLKQYVDGEWAGERRLLDLPYIGRSEVSS